VICFLSNFELLVTNSTVEENLVPALPVVAYFSSLEDSTKYYQE